MSGLFGLPWGVAVTPLAGAGPVLGPVFGGLFFVRPSSHLWISACPSAKAKVPEKLCYVAGQLTIVVGFVFMSTLKHGALMLYWSSSTITHRFAGDGSVMSPSRP